MKAIILTLAFALGAVKAGAQSLEQAALRTASIGPVFPHPKASDSLTCFGVPPHNSFMGAQARIAVEQGKVTATVRDALGLSPDFQALAAKLGIENKHEVQGTWDLKDCRVSPSGRWTCAGRARIELVGAIMAGEKAWFEADALLVADSAGANLVTRSGGVQVAQAARFGPGQCR